MTARLQLVGSQDWTQRLQPAQPSPVLTPFRRAPSLLGGAVTYPLGSPRAVTSLSADDLPAHLRRYGERPHATGSAGMRLIEALEYIDLDGRGGGHFPAAAKWRAHLAAGGGGLVVANGAEGEPASAKDAVLLQLRPHLVLDGLACAAEAVGAQTTVVWLHDGAPAAHASLVRAVAERREWGLVEPAVRIAVGPDRYLSGESSAIVRALSGGPALPDFRRVPATTSGVDGVPTLIHNVETLARTALAARPGGAELPPASLLTVATPHGRTVVEAASGVLLGQVIDSVLGTGAMRYQQAVLLGGYGGSWVPGVVAAALPVEESAVRSRGISLGAGVMLPLRADTCGLVETAAIVEYLAANSARQCGPCLFGLGALAGLLTSLAEQRGRRRDPARLGRLLTEIDGRGGCHHPDGAARLVVSAARTFAADMQSHVRSGACLHPGTGGLFPVPFPD